VSKIARDLRIYDSASVHVPPREQRWKQVAAGMHMHRDGGCLVTLVDFKAGLEDSARGAITSLDWAVVVIDPTSAAIQLAAEIRNTVDQIRAGELPATGHLQDADLVDAANKVFREATINGILFVLNKVDDSETENYIRRRLKKEGIEPIGAIGRDPSIAAAWLKGAPIRGTKVKRDAQRIVGMLEMAETVHCILTSAQEGQQATVH
jgi:CO dehydrogenase nickel-insertion accessory protein CooC1